MGVALKSFAAATFVAGASIAGALLTGSPAGAAERAPAAGASATTSAPLAPPRHLHDGAPEHDAPTARLAPAPTAAPGCPGPVTTDLRLSTDLVCNLLVESDGVTVDLGGHVLQGWIVGEVNDVTVRNGTIRGPDAEVILGLGTLLERLWVQGGTGFVVQVGGGHIRNSVFVDNVVAVDLYWGNGIVVTGSHFVRNEIGVNIAADDRSVVRTNRFQGNGTGLRILDEEGSGSSDGLVADNEFIGNDRGATLTLQNDGRGNRLRNNLFRDNRIAGIEAQLACWRIFDETCGGAGTRIDGNRFIRNGGAGVPGGPGIVVRGEDGAQRGLRLKGSTATRNAGLGIDAPGVTDGGGNRAYGNGDARQCIGVAC